MMRIAWCGLSMLISLAFAAVATTAAQQGPPPGGMMGGPGGGDLQVVAVPAVQEELKLTAKQKTQLRSVDEAAKVGRQELFAAAQENGMDPQAIGEQMTAIRKEQDAKVGRVLDKKQKARLDQIKLQRDGLLAASRPDVASKLKVTNPQSKQIKKVIETMNREVAAAMPPPPEGFGGPPGGFPGPDGGPPGAGNGDGGATPKKKGGNRTAGGNAKGQPGPGGADVEAFRAKMEQGVQGMRKARESASGQIEAILTEDQKSAWAKLIGEPFDVSTLQPGPGVPGEPGGAQEKGAMKKAK